MGKCCKTFKKGLVENLNYNAWEDSAFRNWIYKIYSPIENVIYKFLKFLSKNSLIFSFLQLLSKNIPVLISLMIVFTGIVPDALWSNKYFYLMGFGLYILHVYNRDKERNALDDLLVLFILTIMLSTVLSIHPKMSVKYLLNYLTIFLIFAIFINNIKSVDDLKKVINSITIAVFFVSAFGILQKHVIGVTVNLSQTDISISQELSGRVYSTMGNPNVLGEYYLLTLPIVVANFLISDKKWLKAFSTFTFLISLYILLATGSRSAWGSFALCGVVFVLLYKPRLLPILIMLGLISFFFMPQNIQTRIASIFNKHDTSLNYRQHIYNSAEIMKDDYKLLGGVGLGNEVFQGAFENYKVKELTKVAHSHNLYLQLAIEIGIFGLIFLIVYLIKMILKALFNKTGNESLDLIKTACISQIAGFMLMGIADYTWFYLRIVMMFFITMGILYVVNKKTIGGEYV